MTESANKLDEEIVSGIITSTCQLLPKSFSAVSDHMHDLIMSTEPAPKDYSILSGSMAEFYIRPLNKCITDTDFLTIKADELAFSADVPVLPSDISGLCDAIECWKIEPYDRYPGFVRLRVLGKMNYNWKYKNYEFEQTAFPYRYKTLIVAETDHLLRTRVLNTVRNSVSGPAIQFKHPDNCSCCFGFDFVKSVWCPQWPREAQNWPKRQRYNGWPTTDTISEVVQNGYHAVYVQHRSCRDDSQQWRLSFSFAEVILLQSWTPVQQIVYHLLRFFSARELIDRDCPKKDEVLCKYHLKTLMLWTCEEMPPEWWNSSSVIAICCALLEKLSEWLKRGYCPNYFIPKGNLFHDQWNPKMYEKCERQLNKFCNSRNLCLWLVENYLPSEIQTNSVSTRSAQQHFVDYMPHLFEFRKANQSMAFDAMLSWRFQFSHDHCRTVVKYGYRSGLRYSFKKISYTKDLDVKTQGRLTCLPTIENVLCFTYLVNLLYILHMEYGIGCGEISWDSMLFVELFKAISMQPRIVRSKHHSFPKAYRAQDSQFQFLRAQDLMQNLTGSNNRSEFRLVSLMSTEFLRRALECDDSQFNGIAPAALAYLAALHFATSEYQPAIRFCSAILVDETPQNDKETLNAGCLLFIDDIARIVGLCVLHKKIFEKRLNCINRRLYLDLRLSPEVFAYYIVVFSAEMTFNYSVFHHNLPESAFPMDRYFKTFIKLKCILSRKSGVHFNAARQIVYHRTDPLTEFEDSRANSLIIKETVIGVLMDYALENMASFYNVMQKDFGIQCNTADCYRALHLYKCRKYDQVLHLCEQILHESDLLSDLKEFAFANVLVLPPLDSFFDGDVQSILGFHTLFYYLSPLNGEMQECISTPFSTFAHFFGHVVCFHKDDLAHSLEKPYSIKSHYFLGRHFLARYLKLRCCIYRNHPCTQAMVEFAAQKTNLPFEQIIRRFLLQKLCIIKHREEVS